MEQLRTGLALTMPFAVAVASVALGGNPLDSKEAWIQISKETGTIADVIIVSILAAIFVASKSSNDNEARNAYMTFAAITASGAYVWAILSQGSAKDMRQIFMDKALNDKAVSSYLRIWVASVAGFFLFPRSK